MILFRTHKSDPATKAFCNRLRDESGLPVVCLVDESKRALDFGDLPKIAVTAEAMRQLGLYCPEDFRWRCGDYSLYLAAQGFKDVGHFWMVEYDVRISLPGSLDAFFAHFSHDDSDLIAPLWRPRATDDWWYPAMTARNQPVYSCLFPLVRVSARLAEAGLQGRRRISSNPLYRLFWPNDESFLSTEANRLGFKSRDINTAERVFYTPSSFTYDVALSGEAYEAAPPDGLLHHPVLYGSDYERKRLNIDAGTTRFQQARRKLRLKLARFA